MKIISKIFFILVTIGITSAFGYTVPLPRKMVAENIVSTGAGNFLMSDVPTGNVVLFNIYSGEIHTVVDAPPGRLIQGLALDSKRNLIIAAGSGTPYAEGMNRRLDSTPNVANLTYPPTETAMNIYNGFTGETIAQCNATGAVLIKDVALDPSGNYAYFTDAFATAIYQLDLNRLPECAVKIIPLPYFHDFDQNESPRPPTYFTGIAAYQNGLIINSYTAKMALYLDPSSGYTKVLSKGVGNLDGLKIVRNCMYAVDGLSFDVKVFRIHPDKANKYEPSLEYIKTMHDSTFTSTTGVAFSRKTMIVKNADNTLMGEKGQVYLTVKDLSRFPAVNC